MEEMIRYSIVENKNKREIVMLKGKPCIWGNCAFCDYIADNETNEKEMEKFNQQVIAQVKGIYGCLEVINSGSVFELPKGTLNEIKEVVKKYEIKKLFFESYWSYRDRLQEIRDFFEIPIIFKCGVETFDNEFRNRVLKKGFLIESIQEVTNYFDSICIMVGVNGQTKEMIANDIEKLLAYFNHGCVNVFVNNSTEIRADEELISWFKENYSYLDENPKIEVLWNNTDFGVGGSLI